MATNARIKQDDAEVVEITVRDRRQVYQFSIHNLVIDEWLPIITIRGLALYAFYVRLANKEDERSYPGYRLIQEHLGMSPSTISDYNELLEWCGLIHIEPGDRVTSNDYYILDVPQATPENLDAIRQQAKAQLKPNSKFLKTLLKRLNEWQPIQALWDRSATKRTIIVHKAQLALPLEDPNEGATPAEQGATPAEHPVTPAEEGTLPGVAEQSEATVGGDESSNDASGPAVTSTASFLQNLGVTEPTLSQIAGRDEATAQAWWWYVQTQPGLKKKGIELDYLIKRLKSNDPLLPGYLELAGVWLQLSNDQRWTLLETEKNHRLYRQHWRLPDDCPALDEAAVVALTELVKAGVDFGVSAPTPEQINCPGCDQTFWPYELCIDCDRCPGCCTCEPVVEDPALTEAKAIWHEAVTTLEWRVERGVINQWIRPVQVLGLEDGDLQLSADNERIKEQLEKAVNRGGLIDQAISEAAGRPLKARFIVLNADG
jgi:hypothetical protein